MMVRDRRHINNDAYGVLQTISLGRRRALWGDAARASLEEQRTRFDAPQQWRHGPGRRGGLAELHAPVGGSARRTRGGRV